MKHTINSGMTASRSWKVAIPIITATAVVAGTLVLTSGKDANHEEADALRLAKEELLGEKLQLEKQLAEFERKYTEAFGKAVEADQRALDLEQRLAAARQTSRGGGGAVTAPPGSNSRMKRDLAEALDAQDRLRRELEAARDGQRTLQDQLNLLRADRDAIAARVGQQQNGARMVNNAVVDAVRGKRQHLTVKARRANEIRMAFDLPEDIAPHANFRIITPSGRTFDGAGAQLTHISGENDDGALAARFDLIGAGTQERAARVHLKFRPDKRMESGTYRIDIRSGELYLNTVMLNLR